MPSDAAALSWHTNLVPLLCRTAATLAFGLFTFPVEVCSVLHMASQTRTAEIQWKSNQTLSNFCNAQVRVREHEQGTPLYVVIRKWVQNDPDSDLLPASLQLPLQQPSSADPSAPAGVSKVPPPPQMPALPPAEEVEMVAPPREGPLPHPHREPPPADVSSSCLSAHLFVCIPSHSLCSYCSTYYWGNPLLISTAQVCYGLHEYNACSR